MRLVLWLLSAIALSCGSPRARVESTAPEVVTEQMEPLLRQALRWSPGQVEGLLTTDGHWRWINPLPQGQTLLALHVCSADDVWAAGRLGTTLHFDGHGWASLPSGTDGDLFALWSTGPGDVWAVGEDGTILRWNDEGGWGNVPSGATNDLLTLWGSSATDLWAAGKNGTILHWNGATWSTVESRTMNDLVALWGSGADDVWAVEQYGTVFRWDGTAWRRSEVEDVAITAIWGSGPDDIWAIGEEDQDTNILRWDGDSWENEITVPQGGVYNHIWGSGPNDIWFMGDTHLLHWDGNTWSVHRQDESLHAIEGSGPDDIWAVGYYGRLLRWDGSSWNDFSRSTRDTMRDIWGSGSAMWAVSNEGTVLHWDGSALETSRVGFDVHRGSTEHATSGSNPNAIWGSGPDDIWAVGPQMWPKHWNGSFWASLFTRSDSILIDVWGAGPDDFWAVNYNGRVMRWDGSSWRMEPTRYGGRSKVSGSGPDDVWIIGTNVFSHWDGSELTDLPEETMDAIWDGGRTEILGLWVLARDDAWACSYETLFRWDGVAWRRETEPGFLPVQIWSTEGGARAVGDDGSVHDWDGRNWTEASGSTHLRLEAAWGEGDEIWAIGRYGALLRYQPEGTSGQ